jgi:hypothetical protein
MIPSSIVLMISRRHQDDDHDHTMMFSVAPITILTIAILTTVAP